VNKLIPRLFQIACYIAAAIYAFNEAYVEGCFMMLVGIGISVHAIHDRIDKEKK
jgi:hypothetical protein